MEERKKKILPTYLTLEGKLVTLESGKNAQNKPWIERTAKSWQNGAMYLDPYIPFLKWNWTLGQKAFDSSLHKNFKVFSTSATTKNSWLLQAEARSEISSYQRHSVIIFFSGAKCMPQTVNDTLVEKYITEKGSRPSIAKTIKNGSAKTEAIPRTNSVRAISTDDISALRPRTVRCLSTLILYRKI